MGVATCSNSKQTDKKKDKSRLQEERKHWPMEAANATKGGNRKHCTDQQQTLLGTTAITYTTTAITSFKRQQLPIRSNDDDGRAVQQKYKLSRFECGREPCCKHRLTNQHTAKHIDQEEIVGAVPRSNNNRCLATRRGRMRNDYVQV